MGAILDALQRLQEIQTQIAAIRSRTESSRRRVRAQTRALEGQDALIAAKETHIRQHRMEMDRIELDLRTREEVLVRHREALNRTKSNKDYAAILTSINTDKADNAKLESRQLQVLAEIEQRQSELEVLKTERRRIAERVAAAQQDLEHHEAESDDELKGLERDRDAASDGLPRDVLTTFWRVADKHDGEALAHIGVLNAKRGEHCCTGCNMSITLETVSCLQTRDELQTCPSCGRILYFAPGGVVRGSRA